MATMDNKLLAEQVWKEIWHQGDMSRIDNLFTADFVRHDPGRELPGIDQNRQFISGLRAAFPDLHFVTEDQVAEGDKVVVRYHFQGISGSASNGRRLLIRESSSISLPKARLQNNGPNLIFLDFSGSLECLRLPKLGGAFLCVLQLRIKAAKQQKPNYVLIYLLTGVGRSVVGP
jgi:predicted SnoaL-like aldol condensation-catalyzing enzyme